ncbi:MAG TPA: 2-C-methyl-D-erythritol 4-phosphate cytidylyltransferase [Steroidobacteraceae bacterium]|nr:2-C-methyl-D-erythritol 4-phosphate cytidylyltransferase [Steroidobacteraceae bacterium]
MPAAGAGERMGTDPPKQYRRLGERTVIEHALAPFLADTRCVGLIVALRAGDTTFRELPPAADPRLATVTGGAERALSVARGLKAVAAAAGTSDPWVLVHDAARPCLPAADLEALLAALPDAPDGALLGVRVADTLKRTDASGRIVATLPRESLWRAATPQAFRLRRLLAALAAAPAATDEASAVEALGDRPQLIAGSPLNVKLTTPLDLAFAARILAGGRP